MPYRRTSHKGALAAISVLAAQLGTNDALIRCDGPIACSLLVHAIEPVDERDVAMRQNGGSQLKSVCSLSLTAALPSTKSLIYLA